MLSNHLILCRHLLFLPSIFPSLRVFSNESVLHIKWQKYWSFSFSISPSRRRQWQPTPVLLPGKSHGWRSLVGCSPWGHKESDTTEQLHFHALEKAMATHSSVLAWRMPGTGEPGGLPSMGSHRVGHNWSDLAAAAAASILPINTQDWFPLGWTGWISLQSKGISRVFSNTTGEYFYNTIFIWWLSDLKRQKKVLFTCSFF